MEILAKLFGGQARVKIMRLFLLNSDKAFEVADIVSHTRVTKPNVRKEINSLSSMMFIKQKLVVKEGSRGAKKKVPAWVLNNAFQHLKSVKEILLDPDLLLQTDLVDRFKQVGKIKLMITSGVFIGDEKSRADLLIVGDKLKRNILQQVVKSIESEVGKELNYVVFDTEEFKYRIDMYDKLVCEIVESPHLTLIDSGNFPVYISKK